MISRGQLVVFLLTFFGYAGLHSMRTSWSYSKKLLQNTGEAELTNQQLGVVDTVFMFSYSLGLAFIGPLGDKFNRRFFISAGYYTCALAFLVYPLCRLLTSATSVWILVVFMGVNGVGESVGMPGSMGVLSRWFRPENRGLIIGIWAGCLPFGNILGLMASTVITQYTDLSWHYNFVFTGTFTLTMATLVLLFLRSKPEKDEGEQLLLLKSIEPGQESEDDPSQKKYNFLTCFTIPRVVPYTITYSCLKSSIYGLLFWLPKYIHEKGMTEHSGYILMMMDVGTLLGGITIGYLGDFIKKRSLFLAPFILFSCIMMLVALLFLDAEPLPYFFVIFLMGVGLGGPYNIVGTVIAIDIAGQDCLKGNRKVISTITAVIDASGALCSSLTQFLLSSIPNDWIFAVFTIYTFLAAMALLPLTIQDFKAYRKGDTSLKDSTFPDVTPEK